MAFWHNIFSVTNKYDFEKKYKIFKILGIKIKVKYKKPVKYLSNTTQNVIEIKHCPLCGSEEYIVKNEYPIDSLIERWKDEMSFVPISDCYKGKILERRICTNCQMHYYNYSIPDTAQFYEELVKVQRLYSKYKWDYDEALKIVQKYKPKSYLDIGCGYGFFIEKIKNAVKNVAGSEFNPAAAEVCKSKSIKLYTINLKEVQEKFDMISAFQVFEHVKDNKTFIEDCINLLNDNGYLLIATPNPDSELIKYCPGILELPPHHCCDITKQTYEYIAKTYNLEIVEYMQQELEPWVYSIYLKNKYGITYDSKMYNTFINEKNNLTGKSHMVLFKKL